MTEIFDVLTAMRAALILLGLIGNIVSFVVFSRPVFSKNSISTYSRALAIFESYTLGQLITDIVLLTNNFLYLANSNILWCKVSFYMNTGLAAIPGWILIAFSIDKILNMKRIKSNWLKKRWAQYTTVLGLAVFNLLLYIEIPIFLAPVTIPYTSITICDTSLLSFGTAFNILNLVAGSLLPFAIMFVTSIVSIKLIRDSKKAIERRSGTLASSSSKLNVLSRDAKFAVTTITFNVLFVTMRLPIIVVSIYGYTKVSSFIIKFALLLHFLNSSMCFVVHFVSNSLFRRELARIFRLTRDTDHLESSATIKLNTLSRTGTNAIMPNVEVDLDRL